MSLERALIPFLLLLAACAAEIPSQGAGDDGPGGAAHDAAVVPGGGDGPPAGRPDAQGPHPSEAVFDENVLETFVLTMAAADWNKLVNDPTGEGDLWQPATLTWRGEVVPDAAVKVVGTRRYPGIAKPSIRIKFDELAPGRDWRGLDSIKLEGDTNEGITERLSYWAFREVGVPAPRASHALLSVNGDSKGVFGLSQSVRKKFLSYALGIANPRGNLYYVDRLVKKGDIYRWKGPSPALYVPLLFDPITNETDGDYSDIVTLVDILNNKSGAARRTALESFIDFDSFILHLAVMAALADGDGITGVDTSRAMPCPNNHFWYHRDDTGKMHLVPWDTSNGFDGPPDVSVWLGFENTVALRWILDDAPTKALYLAKIKQVSDGPFSRLSARLEGIYGQLKGPFYADKYKYNRWAKDQWDVEMPRIITNAELELAVQGIRDWIPRRLDYLQGRPIADGGSGN